MDRIGAPHSSDTFGLLDTEQPIRVATNTGPKAHVLVCAPSNSALDEIVARLLQHGVLDWCAADSRASCLSERSGMLTGFFHSPTSGHGHLQMDLQIFRVVS